MSKDINIQIFANQFLRGLNIFAKAGKLLEQIAICEGRDTPKEFFCRECCIKWELAHNLMACADEIQFEDRKESN